MVVVVCWNERTSALNPIKPS